MVAMSKNDILEFLSQNKKNYAQKYHFSKLALLGSYARDDAKSHSDIDILYELEQNHKLTLDTYFELFYNYFERDD